MAIKLSGLISQMDTDSMVKELVAAHSIKKDEYVKAQTKLEWKMDAWKALNTKAYSFYSTKLSNMRFSANYAKKSVKVSNDNKATVTASTSAVNGTQKLKVGKVAETGYLTGAKLTVDKDGNKITGKTKLSDLNSGFSEGMIRIRADGKETSVEITGDMTISQFTAELKSAGLGVNFDEANQRLYINSKQSGKDNDFSLAGNNAGIAVLQDLGIFTKSTADVEQYDKYAAYTNDDLTNLALNDYLKKQVSSANKTYSDRNTALNEENSALSTKLKYVNLSTEKKADARETLQKKIDDLESKGSLTAKEQANLDDYKKTMGTYDQVDTDLGITWTPETDANGETIYKGTEPNAGVLKSYKENINNTIQTNKDEIKVNKDAIEKNNKLLEKTYKTDEITALEFTEYGNNTPLDISGYQTDSIYNKIYANYEDIRNTANSIINGGGPAESSGAKRIEGVNSEIKLNGVDYTSSTNNYSINGLTITVSGTTDVNEEILLTTSTDVDGIYNMVKDFLTSYNELIKEMDTKYNAPSAKGYEPLTSDEKDEMSESEIKKWEAKINDSLLRRDSTLNGVISTLKMGMSSSFKVGDQNLTLSSFGISTMGYFGAGENEKGVYHIDGDTEDASTSGKEDKLRSMIASDPDKVVEFFSQLGSSLYKSLSDKMSASTVRSAYTLYNDKEMKNRYNDYKKTITKWEDKIKAYEDKYYKQFTAMEKALSTMQSNSSYLSSLMGS